MLLSILAYSSTLKKEEKYSFEMSVLIFNGMYDFKFRKIELFITIPVRTSYSVGLFQVCVEFRPA
jgi:hypothetical protein